MPWWGFVCRATYYDCLLNTRPAAYAYRFAFTGLAHARMMLVQLTSDITAGSA